MLRKGERNLVPFAGLQNIPAVPQTPSRSNRHTTVLISFSEGVSLPPSSLPSCNSTLITESIVATAQLFQGTAGTAVRRPSHGRDSSHTLLTPGTTCRRHAAITGPSLQGLAISPCSTRQLSSLGPSHHRHPHAGCCKMAPSASTVSYIPSRVHLSEPHWCYQPRLPSTSPAIGPSWLHCAMVASPGGVHLLVPPAPSASHKFFVKADGCAVPST